MRFKFYLKMSLGVYDNYVYDNIDTIICHHTIGVDLCGTGGHALPQYLDWGHYEESSV